MTARSSALVSDSFVKLIERNARGGIGVELRVSAQRLGDSLVVVVKDGRERLEEVGRKDSTVGIRKIGCEFFDFSNGGHTGSIADADFGARTAMAPNNSNPASPVKKWKQRSGQGKGRSLRFPRLKSA
jgi:hypothetical protein